MWVLLSREYNEDPVLKTMLPSSWLSARRTTMLVIYDNGQTLETLACARYDVGEVFKKAWDPELQPNQWARLAEIIKEKNPQKIGINKSAHFGHADGISSYHYDLLMQSIPKDFQTRVVSAEGLAVGWLETRTDSELAVYQQIVRIAHQIIREGFSDQIIQPGVTTTDDVVWFYRERIRGLGLDAWFHPTVDIQRADPESFDHLRTFSKRPDLQIIQPGDLIHVDFGITYLGLNTDTQQNGYVLKPGETKAPDYLVNAHKKALRLMDILTGEFKEGVTGNQALKATREKAIAEGIKPSIYTHPIGYHGHGAGTAIGMWDAQEGVPFTGDYPLRYNTAFSIELNAGIYLEEWKKEIRMMMEEDAVFTKEGVRYIDGRQLELFLIPEPFAKTGQGF
jgi:Xaa-Pro aminopeptidase